MREQRFPKIILTGHPGEVAKDSNGRVVKHQRLQTWLRLRGKRPIDNEVSLNSVNLKQIMSVFLLT